MRILFVNQFYYPAATATARHIRAAGCEKFFEVHDAQGLVDTIHQLADDPDKATRMGQLGRKFFLEHHERKICCKQWQAPLESLPSDDGHLEGSVPCTDRHMEPAPDSE